MKSFISPNLQVYKKVRTLLIKIQLQKKAVRSKKISPCILQELSFKLR